MTRRPMPREFLETDGLGGFFCGTTEGEVSRRWHGWFAARRPPRDRVRMLAGMEEILELPGADPGRIALSSTRHSGAWRPPDLESAFRSFPFPQWTWHPAAGIALEKEVFLTRDGSTLCLSYKLTGPVAQAPARLRLRLFRPEEAGPPLVYTPEPALAFHHDTSGPASAMEVSLETEKECEEVWSERQRMETEFEIRLEPGLCACLMMTLPGGEPPRDFLAARENERHRRLSLPAPHLRPKHQYLESILAHAADQFLVRGQDGRPSIIAGYPWFSDWGRDAMISLPALFMATGHREESRDVIRHFLDHARGGLIPNLFPESKEEPEHNTIDATLWLVEAAFRAWTPEEAAADDSLREAIANIIQSHEQGTLNDIHLDSDGLLAGGTPGTQLTWMDIKVDGHVPTPRHGKPVEIQGLWYNALCWMEKAARARGDEEQAAHYNELSERARAEFQNRFIDEKSRAADVVDRDGPGTADWTHRPNALIPFALSHNILPRSSRPALLRAAAGRLLTPRGLRSLDPEHDAYQPVYRGSRAQRDRAYHQGTVWMWLLIPYLAGVYTERQQVPELYEKAPELLEELERHFEKEGCAGQASEVFDGDAPREPRGCFAQAWSVAALIQAFRLNWDLPPASDSTS